MKSVIVYGPQGCGKTRNKEALRAHFRLHRVLDNWTGDTAIARNSVLVLTNLPKEELPPVEAGVFCFEALKQSVKGLS